MAVLEFIHFLMQSMMLILLIVINFIYPLLNSTMTNESQSLQLQTTTEKQNRVATVDCDEFLFLSIVRGVFGRGVFFCARIILVLLGAEVLVTDISTLEESRR